MAHKPPYQCEHIGDGSDRCHAMIPLGGSSEISLCERCWIQLSGYVSRETIMESIGKAAKEHIKESWR